jgi:hypothetical protein
MMRRKRTSPRQGLVVLAETEPGATLGPLAGEVGAAQARDLLRCRLLDTIASLGRLNGVTLTVAGEGEAAARALAEDLPAGVDVLAVPDPVRSPAAVAWAMHRHLRRRFARVAVVQPGALPPPVRAAATALSMAATADLVVGPTPAGNVYLVAVRGPRGVAALSGAPDWTADGLAEAVRGAGLAVQVAEPCPVLAELAGLDALRAWVASEPDLAPCIGRWLEGVARR